MNGQVLLQNGTTGVHLNGTWWTTTAQDLPPSAQCLTETDVDYRGFDLYYVNNTMDPGTCCKLCRNDSTCAAWSWTGDTTLEGADPAWAYRCYIKSSSAGRGPYAGHVSGSPGIPQRRLARQTAAAVNGVSPTLGPFVGWNITYLADSTPFVVSFLFYAQHDLLVFAQWFPNGATAINITTSINTTTQGPLKEFASSTTPATMFPTFTAAPELRQAAAGLGAVTWAGRFAYSQIARDQGLCSLLQQVAGAEGGPLVLYNSSGVAGQLASVLVLSPLNNFKGSILG